MRRYNFRGAALADLGELAVLPAQDVVIADAVSKAKAIVRKTDNMYSSGK